MTQDDFMKSLHEDMPEEFGEALYARLQAIEVSHPPTTITANGKHKEVIELPRRPSSRGYLIGTAAAILTLLFVGMLLVLRPAGTTDSLTGLGQLTYDDIAPITAENAAQLIPITTMGRGSITGVAWSPDEGTIAVATSRGLYVHDATDISAAPRPIAELSEETYSPHYTPDGTTIVAAQENSIAQWDAETGELIQRIQTGDVQTFGLWLNPAGDAVMTVGCAMRPGDSERGCVQMAIRSWSLVTGEQTDLITYDAPHAAVAISADWSILAYAAGQNTDMLILVDLASGESQMVLQVPYDAPANLDNIAVVWRLALDETGEQLFLQINGGPDPLRIWDVERLLAGVEQAATADRIIERTGWWIDASVFTSDGNLLLTRQQHLTEVTLSDELTTQSLDTQTERTVDLAFNGDNSRLVTASWNGALQLWDWEDRALRERSLAYNSAYGNHISFSADGDQMASSGVSGGAIPYIWDVRDLTDITGGAFLGTDPDLLYPIPYATFGPDGSLAYVERAFNQYSSGEIWLRDIASGEEIRITTNGFRPVFIGGDTLVDINPSGAISRWQVAGDEPERQYAALYPRTFEELNGRFFSDPIISFSPDGDLLIGSACVDRERDPDSSVMRWQCESSSIRLWDGTTGRELALLAEGPGFVIGRSGSVAFSPDGRYAAASYCRDLTEESLDGVCAEGVVQLWDVSAARETLGSNEAGALGLEIDPVLTLDDFVSPSNRLVFSPIISETGDLLMVVEGDDFGSKQVWRVNPSTGEAEMLITLDDAWGAIGFNPEGTLMALGGDGFVTLYGVPR